MTRIKTINTYAVFLGVLILSFLPTLVVHKLFDFQIALFVLISISLSFMIYSLARLQNILVENSNYNESVEVFQDTKVSDMPNLNPIPNTSDNSNLIA